MKRREAYFNGNMDANAVLQTVKSIGYGNNENEYII